LYEFFKIHTRETRFDKFVYRTRNDSKKKIELGSINVNFVRQLDIEFSIKEQRSESDDKKYKKLHLNYGIRLVVDRISLSQIFKNIKITVTIEENHNLLKNG